jgi:hypothetical protein
MGDDGKAAGFVSAGGFAVSASGLNTRSATLNQYDCSHPRDGKHESFPRFVVTSKPFDLHVQHPMLQLNTRHHSSSA